MAIGEYQFWLEAFTDQNKRPRSAFSISLRAAWQVQLAMYQLHVSATSFVLLLFPTKLVCCIGSDFASGVNLISVKDSRSVSFVHQLYSLPVMLDQTQWLSSLNHAHATQSAPPVLVWWVRFTYILFLATARPEILSNAFFHSQVTCAFQEKATTLIESYQEPW